MNTSTDTKTNAATTEDERDPKHTVSIHMHNRPGVLNRVALVFARRGWNIDGLAVSEAHDGRFARCTITARGDAKTLHLITAQLEKLVDVVSAVEHNDQDSIGVELALIKVRTEEGNPSLDTTGVPTTVVCTIVDVGPATITVQIVGTSAEVEECHQALDDTHGVVEIVRTGTIQMARGDMDT